MKKIIQVLPLFLIFLAFVVAIISSAYLPGTLVTHWGINGEPNGYSNQFFGLYFMPLLSLALYLLFRFLPQLDPYKKNYNEFKSYYDWFVVIITLFLFYLYLLTIVWNFGFVFNFIQLMIPGFTMLLFYTGVLMANTHQNWFVGIRTPWTMSSPLVWKKTHILGSKLFKLAAIVSLLGFILPQLAIYFILVPLVLVSIFLYVFSYWEFRHSQIR